MTHKTELEWHYLPELPEEYIPVIFAKTPHSNITYIGHITFGRWFLSDFTEIPDSEHIYAWAYMPTNPPQNPQ